MRIRHITIRDFGCVDRYDAALTPELNILDSCYAPQIAATIEILLCSKALQSLPPGWLHPTTYLFAEVLIDNCVYYVHAALCGDGLLLHAADHLGRPVTERYRDALSHCLEQDATESFDGQDRTLPFRLCWYRNGEDCGPSVELSHRTDRLADTKTFRTHLRRYIQTFRPEPINCKKDYRTGIDSQGQFYVFRPDGSADLFLSATEEKLFRYICFLNIAEFWVDIEKLRDMHHEKKPLVIQNFLEFLDASTDISALIARTRKLQRQVILLTTPMSEETKENWLVPLHRQYP